jgi:uncharacterized protein YaaR (DUF327 family)
LLRAFPGTSKEFTTFLKQQNKRSNKLPNWHVIQIENFVNALNRTAFELERARQEGRLATLAWLARNFLELSIWIEYCCASGENAKRFNQDTTRDIFEMIVSAKIPDLTPTLRS